MATTFDITGRINAVVSAGSLNMLKKLQKELRLTANTLLKMGDKAAASALGHTAMALDRVAGGMTKTTKAAKETATSVGAATAKITKLKGETKEQTAITKRLSKEWKLSGGEILGLTKAVGLLGNKFGYSANAQKEWIPALQKSLVEINKQKVAMVASGRAITAHVTGQELFARTNQALASGLHKVSGKLTDYDGAMTKSLGRSPAFRAEVDKIAVSVGKQGETFKNQFAALTKVDNVWRDHVTTMRKAGTITTAQATKMYGAYSHLGLSAKELQARIKASNGELINSATYNKAAREELTRHTKAMTLLRKGEEKLAAVSGKSIKAIQGETEAAMRRTKSFAAVTAGIGKQIIAYKDLEKHKAKVIRGEQALAKATGARVSRIKEITARMRAQGITYEDIGKRLDSLKAKHAANTTQMGRTAKASDSLRKTNKTLANEIDALGRIRLKNLVATQATVKSLEGLARKYPQLSKQVAVLSQKVAAGNMPLATADKLLHKLRSSMSQTTNKASLLSRAMSSLVSHLKSFAAYAAAATIISGIAATFGFAVSSVVKFDQALHDLQAITQATDREVGLMGEKIREVGRTTKFSAIEVAAAMRTLGQAGFTAVEAIEAIDSVAALATGTLTSMKIVVDLVTTAIRAFDLEASETSRVADVFANAVNRSKLTIDKLRIAFNYIGPIAAKAGVELEETATLMMMLANAGVRASTSGTGTRRMFQQLMSPTEKFAEAIKKAGYSTEDLNPQLTDMRDVIRRLSEVVPDAQAAFEMFSLRSSAAVAALSSQGVASFDALHSATKRTGSALEMQRTQLEGLGLIYKQAADKATDLALAFGEMGVGSALKFLGKGLQDVLDLLIAFVSSGVTKTVVSMGFWVAAIYAVGKAWALLKVSSMLGNLSAYIGLILGAKTATNALSAATMMLSAKFIIITAVVGALYGAYKLLNAVLFKNLEVDDKFIAATKQRHAEERKRLVTIKDLVSAIRDETASDRERSDNFLKLQKLIGNLNLTVDESTGIVENQTEAIEKNSEALDVWSAGVEAFDNRAEVESLLDSLELYERTNVALSEQIVKLEDARQTAANFAKSSETFAGAIGNWIVNFVNWFPVFDSFLITADELVKSREEGYNKLADAAIKAHGTAQTYLLGLGEMTQEVWESQMLGAGASYDEVVSLVTDATGKITEEHLRMYLELQAAAGGYTETEKKNINTAILEFRKLTNTKQSELQRGLAAIREAYSEQEKIVSAAYDEEIVRLKRQPDLIGNAYEEVLDVVRRKAEKKEGLLEASYQAELAFIINMKLDRKKEQEEIDELNKKTENRRIARAKEVAEILRSIAEDALGILTSNYERETAIYDENIDKRIESINRYYEHEKAEIELKGERSRLALLNEAQYAERWVAIEASASLQRIGVANEYIRKKKDAATSLHIFEKNLAEKFVSLEAQQFDALITLNEQAKNKRLAMEESYHRKQLELIEFSREQAKLEFEEGIVDLIELEQGLNDKLIEIDRASVDTRLEILRGWSDYLEENYDRAISKAREYSNKIIGFEIDIQNIRRKAAEAIISTAASTEDKLLSVRRAGMTKTQLIWSKAQEAYRKMAEANRLYQEVGTVEALAKARKLYGEAQSIYTDLGIQANQAAKEGKNIGVSYTAATNAIKSAGEGIKNVLSAEEKLSVAAKQAEIDVAEQAQRSWADLADDIKEEVGGIQEDINELTGSVEGMVSAIGTIEDKEIDVGANEEMLNTSIRLVGDLWTNINNLKDKVVKVTVDYTENRKAGGLIGKKFDSGGAVPGSGSGDTVPAMLTPGEFVIPKNRVAQFGVDFMESIRSGMLNVGDFLKFGLGGIVKATEPAANTLFPSTNMGDLVSTLTKAVDRLSRAPIAGGSEEAAAPTEGKYDFNLNVGGATLKGVASKSVLERFKIDLRRLERAGGLA